MSGEQWVSVSVIAKDQTVLAQGDVPITATFVAGELHIIPCADIRLTATHKGSIDAVHVHLDLFGQRQTVTLESDQKGEVEIGSRIILSAHGPLVRIKGNEGDSVTTH